MADTPEWIENTFIRTSYRIPKVGYIERAKRKKDDGRKKGAFIQRPSEKKGTFKKKRVGERQRKITPFRK